MVNLEQIGAGFGDPTAASQRIFRASLEAISRPGTILDLESDATAPASVGIAANALLLALLDQDVAVYISPAHLPQVSAYYRFHTGCTVTQEIAEADFVLLAATDPMPAIEALKIGTEYAPDLSATLVWEVSNLGVGEGVTLTGPGIETQMLLHASALNAAFLSTRTQFMTLLPRGVDLFLTCGNRVCGLPRSTRIGS